jgi:hypothetical protein
MASSKVDIKWNVGGWPMLRSEPGVRKALESLAEDIAADANKAAGLTDGFKTSSRQGARRPQGRWRTTVITATAMAMRKNAKHQTLLKALYGNG